MITIGTMIAFSTYAGMLIWPVRGLGQMMGFMGQAFVALERIQEIFDYKVEDDASGVSDIRIAGDIVFENVSFAYGDGEKVLDNISFHIPAGKTTAILGATGAGKSTLVHLLLRLYDYSQALSGLMVLSLIRSIADFLGNSSASFYKSHSCSRATWQIILAWEKPTPANRDHEVHKKQVS